MLKAFPRRFNHLFTKRKSRRDGNTKLQFDESAGDSEFINSDLFLVLTFNMNEKPLIGKQMEYLIPLTKFPKVIVLGFQESNSDVTTDVSSYLLKRKYTILSSITLMQITQLVFVLEGVVVEDLKSTTIATKNGGVASRGKGGIAVSFRYKEKSYCFITAHLAAHRRYFRHRNLDAEQLMNHIQDEFLPKTELSNWDHVFLSGDLNYRLGSLSDRLSSAEDDEVLLKEPTTEEDEAAQRKFNKKADHTTNERRKVMQMIKNKQYSMILGFCQLRKQMDNLPDSNVFKDFTEAREFSFPPTFKIPTHAPFSYDEKRIPSYPDRILWRKEKDEKLLRQVLLHSPPEVTSSDHIPVFSFFQIKSG